MASGRHGAFPLSLDYNYLLVMDPARMQVVAGRPKCSMNCIVIVVGGWHGEEVLSHHAVVCVAVQMSVLL